jgi:hypothetical protein
MWARIFAESSLPIWTSRTAALRSPLLVSTI